jgi:hypothetical protein
MEHLPYSPDLAPNDFWLFPKIKVCLKGTKISGYEDIQKYVMMILKATPQQNSINVSNSGSTIGLSA